MAQPPVRDPRTYAFQMLMEWSKKGHDVSPQDEEQVQQKKEQRPRLRTAIEAEFPKRRRGKERRLGNRLAGKFYDPKDAARIYRKRWCRLKVERDRLAAELAKHTSAQSQDGRWRSVSSE